MVIGEIGNTKYGLIDSTALCYDDVLIYWCRFLWIINICSLLSLTNSIRFDRLHAGISQKSCPSQLKTNFEMT